MSKEPWQVPDHRKQDQEQPEIKPSKAWQRAQETRQNSHQVGRQNAVQQPKVLRLVVFLVGMGLLLYGLSIAFPTSGGSDPYLVRSLIIALIFGGAAAFWSRSSIWRIMKMAGIWALIIGGISIFYLYRSDFGDRFMSAMDPAGVTSTEQGLVVKRARDGHFWLRASINGKPILMMVDTGASNVVLSQDDARRVGFDMQALRFDRRASTANGDVMFAGATAGRLDIGKAVFYDVPVTVNGAEMDGSLLGMSVLDRFASVEFRGDSMILRQ